MPGDGKAHVYLERRPHFMVLPEHHAACGYRP